MHSTADLFHSPLALGKMYIRNLSEILNRKRFEGYE